MYVSMCIHIYIYIRFPRYSPIRRVTVFIATNHLQEDHLDGRCQETTTPPQKKKVGVIGTHVCSNEIQMGFSWDLNGFYGFNTIFIV